MIHVGDNTWNLRVFITDLQVEKTLRVRSDLHVGGVMLKLVDPGTWSSDNCPDMQFVVDKWGNSGEINVLRDHLVSFLRRSLFHTARNLCWFSEIARRQWRNQSEIIRECVFVYLSEWPLFFIHLIHQLLPTTRNIPGSICWPNFYVATYCSKCSLVECW